HKHKIACPKCTLGEVTFNIQDPTILNSQTLSVIAVTHTRPGRCNTCQREFVLTVGSASLNFNGMTEVVPESGLVLPQGAGAISTPS
ncbi:MAG TPA: hypothetical protein VJN64_01445, partial [Terriglobales bacterium]|nr:hypothetical protein [Terriglobales bacterium]